jgi:PKD repeat protein
MKTKMTPSVFSRLFLVVAVILSCFYADAQSTTINITVLNGNQIRCYPDSVVRIRITPNPTLTFNSITLDWGDGSPPVTINPGDSLERVRTYPIEALRTDCTYGEGCSPLFNGFCFTIGVRGIYTNGLEENNQFVMTFRFPPRPDFINSPAIFCQGTLVTFTNKTCPSNDNSMMYTWIFPDGSTSINASPTFTFPNPGTFPVKLIAENSCGRDSIVKNITVQSTAVAVGTLDSGSVSVNSQVVTICLNNGGYIRLHATQSQFASNYLWSIVPSTGWQQLGQNNTDTVRYRFLTPGNYRITLRVNNACNIANLDTINVYVLQESSLQLQNQQDTCPSLMYTPRPLLPGVVYAVNGVTVPTGSFPVNISPSGNSPETVIVSAAISGVCGNQIKSDTFTVFPLVIPSLISPATDTTICPGGPPLPLLGFPSMGQWSGTGVTEVGGQYFFNPALTAGEYTLQFAFGTGACRQTKSVKINIRSVSLSISGPDSLCVGTGEHQLQFTPTGGIWTGSPGIINSSVGIFNTDVAGVGAHGLTYTYTDITSGCVISKNKNIEVVALPQSGLPDSIQLCASNQVFNLPQLANYQPIPAGGSSQWIGERIVNITQGLYNAGALSPGVLRDTVVVTYTISPGCSTTDTLMLSLAPVPLVSAGADTTLCNSGSATLMSSVSGPGVTWSGPGINPNSGIINLSNTMPGINRYVLTYMPTAVCVVRDTVQVTIVSGSGLSLAFQEAYVCDTASMLTLPTASLTGSWSGLPGISANTLSLSGLSAGVYPLTFTTPSLPAACREQVFTLRLIEQPDIVIAGDSTGCRNAGCVSLTASGTPVEAYSWDFGDGSSSTLPDPCHEFIETGDFSITLRASRLHPVTNAVLCSATDTRIVAIREPPLPADIQMNQSGLCPPVIVQFQPDIINAEQTYEWNFGNFDSHIGSIPSPILFQPGVEDTVYQATLVTRNWCGESVSTVQIPVSALARADLGIVYDRPCSGDSLILTNRSTGGILNSSWMLSSGETFNAFQPPILFPLTDSLVRIIQIDLIVSNSCNTDTVTREVAINPTDVRALLQYPAPSVCLGDTLTFTNISTPGAPVRWLSSDGNLMLGDTVRHVFTESGNQSMTIYAYGCGYDSSVWPIQVWPLPEIIISHNPVACVNTNISIEVTGDVVGQTLYYGTGDSTQLSISNYVFSNPGQYNLLAVGNDLRGCRGSSTSSIVLAPAPDAIGVAQDSLCENDEVVFSSLSTGSSACVWIFGDGTGSSSCMVGHRYDQPGTYLARLEAISNLGCRDTTFVPVYIRQGPSSSGFSYAIQPGCSPTRVDFIGPTEHVTGWNWEFGDGATSTAVNPVHTYQGGGTFQLSLIINNEGICFDTITQALMILGTPQFDTLVTDQRCLPTDPWIMDVILANNFNGTLIVSGENVYDDNIINRVELTKAGPYLLTLISDDGCENSMPFFVPTVIPLSVTTRTDTTVLLCEPVFLQTDVNANDVTISWTPSIWLNDSTIMKPTANPLSTTTYVITVERNGCLASDTVTVFVDTDPRIYFPNVFSPNGDGFNDVYRFYCGPGIEQIQSFKLFTRWGEMVYSRDNFAPNDSTVFWTGEIDNKLANQQVIVYQAIVLLKDGRILIFSGDITLLK